MINVALADHLPVFRTGLARLLAAEDDIRIVAQAQSTDQLLNAVEKLRPHVVILSSGFLDNPNDIHRITNAAGQRPIAILMLFEGMEDAAASIPPGLRGVLSRKASAATLVESVRCLAQGGSYLRPRATGADAIDVVGERVTSELTRRELKIIAAVVQGYRNREIAAQLGTSEQMIKNAMQVIYDKTGVSDRLELALYVIHHQVLARATVTESRVRLPANALAKKPPVAEIAHHRFPNAERASAPAHIGGSVAVTILGTTVIRPNCDK
ncbi:MAG TPA: response regulator transcription factor [Candidatus Binatia bacterium]|nr:response regulator transcription factor [Candidatus Binatia bacterium]